MSMGTIGRSLAWLATGAVLATATMLATQVRRGTEAVVLRSYDVRPELASEISSALGRSLAGGKDKDGIPYGQVTLSPNGQLLVTAPPSVQRGVAKVLEDIEAREPLPTPTIRFEAWLVAASPGNHVDSPNLEELEPALHAVEQSRGSMHFELLEKLSTQVRSGQGSKIEGQRSTMEVNTSLRSNGKDQPLVAARVGLQLMPSSAGEYNSSNVFTPGRGTKLEAQTEMRPGELLVVGQSSLPDKSSPARELYYIVRASL